MGSADNALKSLSTSLGLVQDNLARKQLTNAFKDAGFTPDQLKSYATAEQLLPVLADHIRAIGDAADQAAIAKRLGILELLPLLQRGGDAFNKLAREARDLGVVLGSDLVEQADEFRKKMAEVDDVTKSKLNASFLQFGGTLIWLKDRWSDLQLAALGYLATITGTRSLDTQITEQENLVNSLTADPNRYAGNPLAPDLYTAKAKLSDMYTQRDNQQRGQADSAAFQASARASYVPAVPAPGTKPAKTLTHQDPINIANPLGFPNVTNNPDDISQNFITAAQVQDQFSKVTDKAAESTRKLTGALGPLNAYFDKTNDAFDHLGEQLQNEAIEGMHSLSTGLADAIVNAKNLGDVAAGVFRKMIADLLSTVIERGVTGLVGGVLNGIFHIPTYAAGTDWAPGGLSMVGEQGPELVNLPAGSRVWNNTDTMGMLGGPRISLGGIQVSIDARGAGPREVDLLGAQLAQLQQALPALIIKQINDGYDRNLIAAH